MPRNPTSTDGAVRVAAGLLSATLICAILYGARVVLIPCALALLISFMLQPVVRRLRRLRLPRAAAVIVTVSLFAGVLGGLSWLIGGQLAAFFAELPRYRTNIVAKITEARRTMSGGTIAQLQTTLDSVAAEVKNDQQAQNPAAERAAEPVPVTISSPNPWLDLKGVPSIGPLVEPLATGGLVALLVVLMLLQWSDLRSRLVGLLTRNVTGAAHALDDAGRRIGRYLGMQLLVNSSFGLIVGTALYFLSVPYAALWGLCAALFRYVPYAGPVVAAALPLLVSLVTSDGWSQFAGVALVFVVLELLSNNLVEPWLYGSSLGISEIGIVLTAVAWTVLWGPAGLVLSTPLTVCLVVLGEHVPSLAFFSRLLGDKPVLSPHHQFYQQLLARDDNEATHMLQRLAAEEPEASAVERLALPSLAFASREHSLRRLSTDQAGQVIDRARDLVPPEPARSPDEAAEPAGLEVPVVLWSVCPFSDAAQDYLAARLDGLPCQVEAVRSPELIGHALARIGELTRPPAALALVQLHAGDDNRIRGLVKRLRAAFPALPVLVARWDGRGNDAEENGTLTGAGATSVAYSLGQTRDWLAARIVDESCRYRSTVPPSPDIASHEEARQAATISPDLPSRSTG